MVLFRENGGSDDEAPTLSCWVCWVLCDLGHVLRFSHLRWGTISYFAHAMLCATDH